MNIFHTIAILLTLTALGSYLNQRFLKLPATIGLLAFAFLISLFTMVLGRLGWVALGPASSFIRQIDFSAVLLHGLLSFLLFAGALHINLDDLKTVRWQVGLLATLGVLLATFITGSGVWLGAGLAGFTLPYIYALLFGALIAPTDPIAVLSVLKDAGIGKTLYAKIGGESLLNDGVGVVVFLTILGLATHHTPPGFFSVAGLLARESLGGIGLGLALGWAVYRLLRSIDAYKVEVLLTLALVSGGYMLAETLHVSAPLYMVTAGLVVGNHGRHFGMSAQSRERLDHFWELIDEMLNAVLFMLMGLELIVIPITKALLGLGLVAAVATLMGRLVSVALTLGVVEGWRRLFGRAMAVKPVFDWRIIGLLSWGGLRGGLSIAMALALPLGQERAMILPITYITVLFSILLQGLTFKPALRWLIKRTPNP